MINVTSKHKLVSENCLELNINNEKPSKVQIYRLKGNRINKYNLKEEKPLFYVKYFGGINGKLGIETKRMFASPPEIQILKEMCLFDKNYRSKKEEECRRTKSTSFYKTTKLEKHSEENNNKFLPQTNNETPIKYRLLSSKDDHHSLSIMNFKKEENSNKTKTYKKLKNDNKMHFLLGNLQKRLHSSLNKSSHYSRENSKNKDKCISDFLQNHYSNTRNFLSGKTIKKDSYQKPLSILSKNCIPSLFEFKKYTQLV